jgi:hypothetical protein
MAWWGFSDFSITRMTDGYRVTGRGRCIPCDSAAEAESVIRDLLAASSTAGGSAHSSSEVSSRSW